MVTPKEVTARFGEALCMTDSPIAVIYRDEPGPADAWSPPEVMEGRHVCALSGVRNVARQGKWVAYDEVHIGCLGGKRYLGFAAGIGEGIEYFLSHGIPGQMEGERYKKTPEIAKATFGQIDMPLATGKYCLLAPLDQLDSFDGVEVIAFLATPDQIAGLFTLANYASADPNAVICPWGAGCMSLIGEPRRQAGLDSPKAVIGMFDPSARPCVPAGTISFAGPTKLVLEMAENIGESFVITPTWQTLHRRMSHAAEAGRE